MSKIAELQEFKEWNSIKSEFIKLNNITTFSDVEKQLFCEYKVSNNEIISYYNLTKAQRLSIKENHVWKFISPISKIEYLSSGITKKTGIKKKQVFLAINNKEKISLANIHAYYLCVECSNEFRVECNFVKWAKYFHGPVCKSCKKKIVTKTNSYWDTYKKSMQLSYGCDFPIQNTEIRHQFENTMMKKYGVRYSGQSSELLAKSYKNTSHKFRVSKQEMEFAEVIRTIYPNALTYSSKKRPNIKCSDGYKYPDIIIGNLIIEYFGDYWHMNPSIYDSKYKLPSGQSASEKWNEDEKRLESLKNAGYCVMIVWEKQWKENSQYVLSEIKKALNVL